MYHVYGLWLNLSRKQRIKEPKYRRLQNEIFSLCYLKIMAIKMEHIH